MLKEGIDAFLAPTDDPHMSEYTAPYYGRREFISGFTGSAGTAVITTDKALLFTDGRYHNQAELELDAKYWTLMRQGLKDVPTPTEFLSQNLKKGSSVGIDATIHSATFVKKMIDTLNIKNINVKIITENPIDDIWGDSRPAAPSGLLRIHDIAYAGKTVSQKLTDIRQIMKTNNVYGMTVTSLDEIAWLFNVRGCDVPCNPVAVAYAIITLDSATLYINDIKVTPDVKKHLSDSRVNVSSYDGIFAALKSLSKKGKIWIDGKTANYSVYKSVEDADRVDKDSPIILMKAKKNDVELAGMKACHIRDGAAVAEFLSWLEEEVANGQTITEVEVDEKITASRASFGMFLEPSFPTIAGASSNGAIVHYRAVKETCKVCTTNDLLLLDSGGQYLDGTTDVTRTLHLGNPSNYQKDMFTRVLKGHIGVDSRVFPVGTPGCLLDSYAREHLWAIGKDFIHGTGHGVGAALNVHEGPHRISRALDPQPLQPGMVVSNEPGYYETDNFGIRIENLLVVVPKPELPEFSGRSFLGFERLTHIPIQQKMIDISLLTDKEVEWINTYHQQIKDKVYPLLRTDRARKWMEIATKPIQKETTVSGSSGTNSGTSRSSSSTSSTSSSSSSSSGSKKFRGF